MPDLNYDIATVILTSIMVHTDAGASLVLCSITVLDSVCMLQITAHFQSFSNTVLMIFLSIFLVFLANLKYKLAVERDSECGMFK